MEDGAENAAVSILHPPFSILNPRVFTTSKVFIMSRFNTHIDSSSDPHAMQRLLRAGPSPEEAGAALVLLHGRGATAESILSLSQELGIEDLAAIAPQAAGNTWYPYSFLAPLEANQPFLDSALRRIDSIVQELLSQGMKSEKIAIFGFSQGACLASEFVARHPRRYGAVMALTGGLIGPPGTPREYRGALAGTPVFLGTSDPDPHVPFERVQETESVLRKMGATVDVRRYPGMPHTINEDELDACRALLGMMKGQSLQK
jgi:predicted esterase